MSKVPPKGEFWKAFAAVTILPINGTQKAVLGCLLDHANPKNGRCYPSEARIAAEIKRPLRTIERTVADLDNTPYISAKPSRLGNSYSINFDALSKAWDDYKARGAAYGASRVTEAVTEPVTPLLPKPKNYPSKVAGHTVKSGGSIPSKVAANNKKRKAKNEKKSRMASPLRGDGANGASLVPPAGEVKNGEGARDAPLHPPTDEVKNVGGVLARFERTFERDPSSIPDLSGWLYWLEDEALHVESDMSDRNAQRARRLADDVRYYLDEGADAPLAGERGAACPIIHIRPAQEAA